MKKIPLLLFFAGFFAKAAVHVNPNGLGEVLLIPYYTTNNGLNTLVTVSNTTEQVKAVKIVFKSGSFDFHRQSLNIYLAPNDTWSFAMVNRATTEANVISQDASCVPFFVSPLELFDHSGDPIPPSFGYAEGLIEVYEMGELDPSYGYGQAVTFEDGEPVDCEQISANWETHSDLGAWVADGGMSEMLPASGGLKSSVSLINVGNGVNYTYDAIALNGFYQQGVLIHTHPWDNYSLSLDDAINLSMVQYQGENLITQWPTGFEAVSAVLSQHELIMDYSNELSVSAQTEVTISFPTRGEYRGAYRNPPFEFIEWGNQYCESFEGTVFDRDGEMVSYVPGSVSPLPPYLCYGVNVIKIWDHYNSDSVYWPILDSVNTVNQSIYQGMEGMFKIKFNQFTASGQSVDGTETHTYYGLPVFALALTRYANANAQPGLLAQYGGAFVPKSKQKIEITNNDQ